MGSLLIKKENSAAGSQNSKKANTTKIIISIIITVFGILNIFPFVFMLSSAFKLNVNVFEYPFRLIPNPLVMDNFKEILSVQYHFVKWYSNTIVLVVITITLRVLIVGITAYALARLKFRGRDQLFFVFLLTLMIPSDSLLVPRYMVLSYLRLTDTMWSIALLFTFEFFLVFLVRQFYLTIPNELTEAAIIDGCNHFEVFFRIILPLSKPAMITMILFTFVWQWNDFTDPFIFISSSDKQMIAVGIRSFATEHGQRYAMQMAGSTLTLLPVIGVFLFVQKYFIEGITTSGIKG
ncbi:MAG: carbohydrate ABC transporter permease [Clostridia bacterium]|nr:carbohydrate ABC transporter permease [Clostridia bacterium]